MGFNKFLDSLSDDNYPNERGIINKIHFENTRKIKPDKRGFYKRNSFMKNWRYELADGRRGVLKAIKDNEKNTFTGIPKGVLSFREITASWNNLVVFD